MFFSSFLPLFAGSEDDFIMTYGYSREYLRFHPADHGSQIRKATLVVDNPDPYVSDPTFRIKEMTSNEVLDSFQMQMGNFNSGETGGYFKMGLDFASNFSFEYFEFAMDWMFGYDIQIYKDIVSIGPVADLYYRYYGSHLYAGGTPGYSDEDGSTNDVFLATNSDGESYLYGLGQHVAGTSGGLGLRITPVSGFLISTNVLLTLAEYGGGENDLINTIESGESISFPPYYFDSKNVSVSLVEIMLLFDWEELFDLELPMIMLSHRRMDFPSFAISENTYAISAVVLY